MQIFNMVDFLNIPFDLGSVAQLASSDATAFWTTIIINLVISTVVGGIVLILVLMGFNRVYGEMLVLKRAFLVVFIVNLINFVGIVGFLTPLIASIPFIGIILPLLIWVAMLKMFFEDMSILHALVVGAVFFVLTLLAIPWIIGQVGSILGI
jgi:hypothetical protein